MLEHTLFIPKIPSIHTWVTMILLFFAMVSYASEKISMQLTSLLVIAFLMTFYHFFPLLDLSENVILSANDFLTGLASPALTTIVCLLIVGQAIIQSNALNVIPNFILKVAHNNASFAILLSFITVIVISAFMNNTPVVVIFIPIIAELCRRLKISPSKLMMPLSYVAILGGMLTLIGSSTNLLISGSVEDMGFAGLDFFEFMVPGAIMAAVGLFYIMTVLPKTLPDRVPHDNSEIDDRVFISQIYINEISELIGTKLVEGHLPGFPDITIRLIDRQGKVFLPPFQDSFELKDSDILVLSANRSAISGLLYRKPDIFLKNSHIDEIYHDVDNTITLSEANIAEIVISPTSTMIGKTVKDAGFYRKYNCPVIGMQRKEGNIRNKITKMRLIAGDVLLILGETGKIIDMRNNKDVIVTKWSMQQVMSNMRVLKTLLIFALLIISSAFKILPISTASFLAVVLLLLLDCINPKQIARAVDYNIVLMISASIAMGVAMQASGAAAKIAEGFLYLLSGLSVIGIIATLFLFVALMTNILSNAATAILFTPIALNISVQIAADPKLFIYAIIFACNCSFITPIGYQTNLLVMSPGKYKFTDFVKAGIPLAILLSITYSLLVIYYFKI